MKFWNSIVRSLIRKNRKTVSAVHRRFQGVEVFPDGLKPIDWWVPLAQQKYANSIAAQ
jgi:hypothetical protein